MGNALSFNLDVLHSVGPKATVFWSWYKSVDFDELTIKPEVYRHSESGFISVNQSEITKALGLSAAEQKTARNRLQAAGYMRTFKGGVSCRVYVQCVDSPRQKDDKSEVQTKPESSVLSKLFNKKEEVHDDLSDIQDSSDLPIEGLVEVEAEAVKESDEPLMIEEEILKESDVVVLNIDS